VRTAALLLCTTFLAACGDGTTRVSMSAKAAAAPGAAEAEALALANGVTVQRVRLVVDRVRLTRASGAGEERDDDREVRREPLLVDLDLAAPLDPAAPPRPIATFDAPAGTYDDDDRDGEED
jgi:hypothetical protein